MLTLTEFGTGPNPNPNLEKKKKMKFFELWSVVKQYLGDKGRELVEIANYYI